MDQHVPRAVTSGLRRREVEVLTAFEDGAGETADPELLDRATALGHVLFTQDDDLLVEAAKRQTVGRAFAGIIYAHQQRVPVGMCVEQLELIAKTLEPAEFENRVIYLPL